MSEYRRCYQSGGYYFFTLVTHHRQPLFAKTENIKNLMGSINKVKEKYPFSLNALVILPDHLHCIWKMSEKDHNFSMRWRLIKKHFSAGINAPINYRNEKEIWQRRFWEHAIRDEQDWQKHMDYIHYNPVKHKLVLSPKDWPYSSFNYWANKNFYNKDWGSGEPILFNKINEAE